ncbi:MAG: class I adenylate cyclase [Desulfobacterales bacterium]|nr:class I adenylate cyclase [Desulfobacterales bacterium]
MDNIEFEKLLDGLLSLQHDRLSENEFKQVHEYKTYFINTFYTHWNQSEILLRQKMIRMTSLIDIENGVRLLMIGFRDIMRNMKEESKQSLTKLIDRLKKEMTDDPSNIQLIGICFRTAYLIYNEMQRSIQNFDLIGFFLYTLLTLPFKGPYFSWKFFNQGTVSQNYLIEMIRKFPEPERLIFIHQFTLDVIPIKRKHTNLMSLLLKDIKDRPSVILFLETLFDQNITLDPVFNEMSDRLAVCDSVVQKEFTSKLVNEKIKGVKILGALHKVLGYHCILSVLYPDELTSARVMALEALSRSGLRRDTKVLSVLLKLCEEPNELIVYHTLNALVKLKLKDIHQQFFHLGKKYTSIKNIILENDDFLRCDEIEILLNALPIELSINIWHSIIQKTVLHSDEILTILLNHFQKSSDTQIKQQLNQFREQLDTIQQKEKEKIETHPIQEFVLPDPKIKKGFFTSSAEKKRQKDIKRFQNKEKIENLEFKAEILAHMDMSAIFLRDVIFDETVFYHVDLSDAHLTSVSFRNCRFEQVKMNQAVLDSVCFDRAVLFHVASTGASFVTCDFSHAILISDDFRSLQTHHSLFIDTTIKDVRFSGSTFIETGFIACDLASVSFENAILYQSDFSYSKAYQCNFKNINMENVIQNQTELFMHQHIFQQVNLPPFMFPASLPKTSEFNLLLIYMEMKKLRDAFWAYNQRRIALALDIFRPEQGDLFKLIPFLLHYHVPMFSRDYPTAKTPCGIFGYIPSPQILQLAKNYFGLDDNLPIEQKRCDIHGVYTVGSIGTIAQTNDSDIDYWVCIEKEKIDEETYHFFKVKLESIEKWVMTKFNTEIHFFVVDIVSARENRFGESDSESSGSAQSKLLKEEFYRTMLFIAGKIPLWCVTPTWLNEKYDTYMYPFASRFDNDYLDLGNISEIPKGEYFGASIWQFFKSVKHPYKSVIKLSLLEKYLQDPPNDLLCNRVKSEWLHGQGELRYQDPYLLLFEELLKFYEKNEEKNVEELIKDCFFLKLGIKSESEFEKSVLGYKKEVIFSFLEQWKWDEKRIYELGNYSDWSFDKVFRLSIKINHHMLETYKRLIGLLKQASDQTRITPEDLTILGRKIAVYFSKKIDKVEKLPTVVQNKSLFQQLNFLYQQTNDGSTYWILSHPQKNEVTGRSQNEILKRMRRVEEIVVWLVHNGLYQNNTTFQLIPNPTPISLQDILELVQSISTFFTSDEGYTIPRHALLAKECIFKLYIVINFSINRKRDKIHEYTLIYTTSWGDMFCEALSSEPGVETLPELIRSIKQNLKLPFLSEQNELHLPNYTEKIDVFIPKLSRKYFQA